jgi:hypothetical protein
MPKASSPFPELRRRLEAVEETGRALQAEGLPFPTVQAREAFDEAVHGGAVADARKVVKRAETLLERTQKDWTWVRELLKRVDELRGVAESIGVDVSLVDARVGNPRAQLMGEPLSSGSLERSAAAASLALAVLNDLVPKYCVQQAQKLGASIRSARDRGEEVRDTVVAFSALVRSLQDEHLPMVAQRLVEARHSVARIPRAPALPSMSPAEEEEILLEARNLARRLHRIRSKARDATGAVRLMTHVRAVLTERRYGSPEEEIEALWSEVDRLTKEKRLASAPPVIMGDEGGYLPAEPVPLFDPGPEMAPAGPETPASTEGTEAETTSRADSSQGLASTEESEPGSTSPAAASNGPVGPSAEPVAPPLLYRPSRGRGPVPVAPPVPPPRLDFEPGEGPFPGPAAPAPRKPPARSPIFASYLPPESEPFAAPDGGRPGAKGPEPRRRSSRHRQ